MDGVSHAGIVQVLAFPAVRSLSKLTIVLNILPVLPHKAKCDHLQDFVQSTEIFLEILANLLAVQEKMGL